MRARVLLRLCRRGT